MRDPSRRYDLRMLRPDRELSGRSMRDFPADPLAADRRRSLGITLAIGLLTGVVYTLAPAVVAVGVALVAFGLYRGLRRAGPGLRERVTGEGVTGDVRLPFTNVAIVATIRKESP